LAQSSRHFRLCQLLFFALVWSATAYPQEFAPRLQLSAQAGPVIFDDLYKFYNSGRYTIFGSVRVSKNLHAHLRGGFIPARQYFATPVGIQDAEVNLYELAFGAKLHGGKFFSSRLRPFLSLMGGVLLYRPQPVRVPIGFGGEVQVDPPDATKPLLSAATGVQWQLTRLIALSLGFEASLSRLAERFTDGTARERWRPFFSAAVAAVASIK
jgi:hypothetical protein